MAAGNKIEKVELFKAPSVRILTNFLSDEECAHLIQEASDKLSRSSVLDKDGQRRITDYRTSWQVHFRLGQDPILAGIEQRLAEHVNLPVEYGEGMQVLRYEIGQEF